MLYGCLDNGIWRGSDDENKTNLYAMKPISVWQYSIFAYHGQI